MDEEELNISIRKFLKMVGCVFSRGAFGHFGHRGSLRRRRDHRAVVCAGDRHMHRARHAAAVAVAQSECETFHLGRRRPGIRLLPRPRCSSMRPSRRCRIGGVRGHGGTQGAERALGRTDRADRVNVGEGGVGVGEGDAASLRDRDAGCGRFGEAVEFGRCTAVVQHGASHDLHRGTQPGLCTFRRTQHRHLVAPESE